MFAEYESNVLRDYQDKKDRGSLLNNVAHPTPARLKKECIDVLDRRYLKKDEVTLSSFFGFQEDPAAYRLAIKKKDTDKFRPLNLLLRKGEGNTDEKNIELLAWLIDFHPRPYASWLKDTNRTSADTGQGIAATSLEVRGEPIQQDSEQGYTPKRLEVNEPLLGSDQALRWRRQLTSLAILLMAVGVVAYFISHRTEKCMYWAGDHYEPISCSARPPDTTVMVLGLDPNKLGHFKRITRADTLTAASINKVWYVKVNGVIEFYTAPGEHPLYPGRRLLPLTAYILNKYPRIAN